MSPLQKTALKALKVGIYAALSVVIVEITAYLTNPGFGVDNPQLVAFVPLVNVVLVLAKEALAWWKASDNTIATDPLANVPTGVAPATIENQTVLQN